MSEAYALGFRRRCGWCGVQLRAWQLNLCRVCRFRADGNAGIYLSGGGPPCREGARWNAAPDRLPVPHMKRDDHV